MPASQRYSGPVPWVRLPKGTGAVGSRWLLPLRVPGGGDASLEASRRDEQNYPQALALLECAAANATGKRLRVKVMVSMAMLHHDMGEVERAAGILEEIEEMDLPADDDRLLLCVRHNRADYLSKLSRVEQARALLPAVRALSRKAGGEHDHARFLWTEARVVAAFGDVSGAIEKLTKVRGVFATHQMDYDTALVSLEAALFYLRAGKTDEVMSVATVRNPALASALVK